MNSETTNVEPMMSKEDFRLSHLSQLVALALKCPEGSAQRKAIVERIQEIAMKLET